MHLCCFSVKGISSEIFCLFASDHPRRRQVAVASRVRRLHDRGHTGSSVRRSPGALQRGWGKHALPPAGAQRHAAGRRVGHVDHQLSPAGLRQLHIPRPPATARRPRQCQPELLLSRRGHLSRAPALQDAHAQHPHASRREGVYQAEGVPGQEHGPARGWQSRRRTRRGAHGRDGLRHGLLLPPAHLSGKDYIFTGVDRLYYLFISALFYNISGYFASKYMGHCNNFPAA